MGASTKLREGHATPFDAGARTALTVSDLRFRNLLSDEDWGALPPATRKRFSKSVAGGRSAVYAGVVLETRWNFAGWVLVQLSRLLGAPFPTSRDCGLPAVVTLTEDPANGGQVWTRLYARRRGFPQIIRSSKRFAGATGLEEHVGLGVGMALRVRQENRTLKFRSAHYYFCVGRLRVIFPAWLAPGVLTVTHAEEPDAAFTFTLEVDHPWFGSILLQRVIFREVMP